MKVVPTPRSLSTLTDPPISSIRDLQILRPRPVPCLLLAACSSNFPKFMNSLDIFSFEIPTPESLILISNLMYLKPLASTLTFFNKRLSTFFSSSRERLLTREVLFLSLLLSYKLNELNCLILLVCLSLRTIYPDCNKVCWL